MLQALPPTERDANLLVGLETSDDAGVYRLRDDLALVQTVDYFTPVVDDPYWFGAIAAANALSDVYAMGGKPLTVLNLVGFPAGKIPASYLAEILRGAADKIREAGAVLVGGHSVEDPEPKFGLAVTGLVHPDRILPNSGARPGDRLVLTKPIGVGIVTTALKRGALTPPEIDEVTRVMATLNDVVDLMHAAGVRGCTDITGFGLLGHAWEMARASGVGLRIHASAVPVLPNAREYAARGFIPGGSKKNRQWVENATRYDDAVDEIDRTILCDAVTSGGLLIAVPAERVEQLTASLLAKQALAAAVIGEVVSEYPGCLHVLP